jgi:hypothetical protein
MFFAASKVFWFFAAPLNVLLLVALIGVVCLLGEQPALADALRFSQSPRRS